MIGKVTRGSRVGDLLYYLYGPGRFNEHVNPHVVAGFRHPAALEPKLRPDGRRDFRHLIGVLDLPVRMQRRRGHREPVWQCSVRAAPGDRVLSDDEWAQVAEEVMHQTGIAPRGDDQACRWVAARHADDHIHIVATLARQDGRRVSVHGDFYRVIDACHIIEERFGLARTAAADKTAAPKPTRAEIEQAPRKGWDEPARVTLRRIVSRARAGAASVEEFLALLEETPETRVRVRFSSHTPGEVTGYAVALVGHTNADGEPVWFSGGKLAPDLTIPQLRRRFALENQPHPATPDAPSTTVGYEFTSADMDLSVVCGQVTRAVAEATQVFNHTSDPRVRADLARAAADTLHLVARWLGDPRLEQAADGFDRAAREPYRRAPLATRHGQALRRAAGILAIDASARGKPEPAIAVLHLIATLIDLVQAIQELRQFQRQTAQAAAARYSIDRLQAVRTTLLPPPPAVPRPPANPAVQPRAAARPATAAGIAAGDFPAGAPAAARRRPVRRASRLVKPPQPRPKPPNGREI